MHSALVIQACNNTLPTEGCTHVSHTDMHKHHLANYGIIQTLGLCTHASYGMYVPYTGAPLHVNSPHHNPCYGPGRVTTTGAPNEHVDFTYANPHVDRSTCMFAQATLQIA